MCSDISLLILACISLMTYDMEHLSIALIFHLCIFFGETSDKVFGTILNWVVFLLLSFKSSLYILLQFFPVCSLSPNSLDIIFCTVEDLNFNGD